VGRSLRFADYQIRLALVISRAVSNQKRRRHPCKHPQFSPAAMPNIVID
jgi:hypothetical protein